MNAASLRERLAEVVGGAQVVSSASRREPYARDASPRVLLAAREGGTPRLPDLVVRPGSTAEVAAVVRLAREARTPVIAYGGGSGVVGGAVPVAGGIALDLKRIDHVEAVEPRDRLVEVGAGVLGEHLEQRLERQGYTAGHVPASMRCSTVGGWIATRSAGQHASRYGKIEDLVSGLTFVDGTGTVHRLEAGPRVGFGPDPVQLVAGSEGVLGVVTETVLRVRRRPEARFLRGVQVPSVDAGLAALRAILVAGLRPSVARLYDPLDTLLGRGLGGGLPATRSGLLAGPGARLADLLHAMLRRPGARSVQRGVVQRLLGRPRVLGGLIERLGSQALLILGFEGQDERLAAHEERRALELCAEHGGRDLGPGPAEHWWAHRYSAGYRLTHALDAGAFVETLDTATTWERLPGLYEAVRGAAAPHALVMAHFSHAYEEGCALQFTFIGWAPSLETREAALDRVLSEALDAALASGGTVSHHHGIGLHRQARLAGELGGGMPILQALKSVLDPDGILNPGKLGLDAAPGASRRGPPEAGRAA